MKVGRGRPRQFDEDAALSAAVNVFWENGYSATSLDDLAQAMQMNRPSIYRAFGDKEALYRRTLAQFVVGMENGMKQTLFAEADLRKALTSFYRQALAIYVSGTHPKGCLVMTTAVTAASSHPDIQAVLFGVIQLLDKSIEKRLRQAVEAGDLSEGFDVRGRAFVAQSVLHSLSLRARAGDSQTVLNKLLKSGVDAILA